MGDAELTVAVADTGPIIHLNEIGCMPLLLLFDSIEIPDAVWAEAVEPGRVPEADLLALANLTRRHVHDHAVARFIAQGGLDDLHRAECEALLLCRQTGSPIVLTDDLAARDAAKRLGVTPVGSLGIVVRACRLGRISLAEAEKDLLALYETSTLFVTRTIVEMAITQLHEDG